MKRSLATALLTSTALAATAGSTPAKAVLNYNIYESSGDIIIEASGSLNLPMPTNETTFCGGSGTLGLGGAVICTGIDARSPVYSISGPSTIYLGGPSIAATSASGIFTSLDGPDRFVISSLYASGSPIKSGALFKNLTLGNLSLPTSGTLGTWTLADTGDTINVMVGISTPSAVPGPLPLLGAGAAVGFSRRFRRGRR